MLGRSPRLAHRYGSSLKILAKAHLRQAEQADWNERAEAVYDLCRQVRAGAKSKRAPYEPPRPRSAIQTEQVASIKKSRGRVPTRERSRQDGECYAVYEHRTNKGDFLVMNSGAATPQNFVRVYEAMPPHRQPT